MAGDKYIYNNAGVLTEKAAVQSSAGAGDAGKIPALDAAGKLDTTMMPTGIGPEIVTLTASEALSAGNLVNIWLDTATPKARKADATAVGKEANGFVLSAFDQDASADVYTGGINTQVSGLTPGTIHYLATSAGGVSETAPSGSGNVVQVVGRSGTATELVFQPGPPIVLA